MIYLTKKLFYNGYIYTMDENNPVAKNILVADNKIIDLNVKKDSSYQLIDLAGSTLFPGFNDSHMHVLNFGVNLSIVDLNGIKSIDEMIKHVKKYINENKIKKEEWLFGWGWNHELFKENRMPNRYDLDKISKEIPLVLTRTCGHLAVINSKALNLLQISKTAEVEGGKIYKDKNGDLTGVFAENALNIIYKNREEISIADIKKYIIEAGKELRKKGITFVQTDDLDSANVNYQKIMQAYYELADENKLPIKFNLQLKLNTPDNLLSFLNKNKISYYNDYLTLGPLKILADGSLGAGTAALRKAYSDQKSNKGKLVYNYQKMLNLVDLAFKNNLQVACHAIGDKTIEVFIDVIEKLQTKYNNNLRNRIVHCQISDYQLLQRMAVLNINADIQPAFTATDWKIVEKRLGAERTNNSYAWKTMFDLGINAAGGSDCPVEDPDPIWGIACAVSRKDNNNEPKGGWLPWQKLSVYDAFKLYTKNAAYNCFMEKQIGQIKKNYKADFTILDKNPYDLLEKDLKKIKIKGTVINGNIYWNK